jgi:hypothetical protein
MFNPMPTLETRWCHPNCNCPIWILYKKCWHFKIDMSKNTHTHKLVATWMWMLLSFLLAIVFQESSYCIFENACIKNSRCRFCMMVCPKFWGNYFYTYLHLCLGADDVNGSYGNLALMFEIKQWLFWHVIKSKCIFSKIRAHKYRNLKIINSG